MRVRQQRLIMTLAALSFLVAVAIIVSSFLIPIESDKANLAVTVLPPKANTGRAEPTTPTIDEFAKVVDYKLQRPLFDPPPPPEEPEPVKEILPPPSVSLVMIITGDENRAMFRDSQGSLMYKTKGESVADERSTAEVVEINKDHVVLKHNEDLIRVTLKSG